MWKTVFRVVSTMFFLLLAYLLQACLMPYLKVFGVLPNIIFSYIAVITVLYGSWYSVATGVFAGLLVETMLAALPVVNAIAYPALAFAAAQFLAYKPERAMKPAKTARGEKLQRLYTPFVRVLIGAAFMTLLYEIIFIVFYFLSGIPISFTHIMNALGAVVYTVFCTVIVYFILWRLLGFAGNRGFLSRIAEGGTMSELFKRKPKNDENEEAAKAARFTRYSRERNTAEGGRKRAQSDIPAGRYSRKSRRGGDEKVRKPRFMDEYVENAEEKSGDAAAEAKDKPDSPAEDAETLPEVKTDTEAQGESNAPDTEKAESESAQENSGSGFDAPALSAENDTEAGESEAPETEKTIDETPASETENGAESGIQDTIE
ncbi:MAG: hypothetical protein PHI27_11115 [Eubacteriales bacterium]|nr:hypothetical protein [Eubacteriales bacterium]MDD3882781.1 hypothetical protein [Eubacteriales bacterium]MDD4512949.1 hypothetical protein [Eubacteriales bacterium]